MAEQDIAFNPNDPEAMRRLQSFINPQQLDLQIRQAIQLCWMMLPAEKKTVDEVEKEIRRIVDRALRDLREDSSAFRWGPE
jgi:hypothetical protein